MSAAKPLPSRYVWLKAMSALDVAMADLSARAAGGARLNAGEAAAAAVAKFKEAYKKPLTSAMYIAGAAMAPGINKAAQEDKHALEKLVLRRIPRPSPRSVAVGDVVAFSSPLDAQGDHVMVRRVAALEAHEMISDDDADASFRIPPGHCWVLADNPELGPPDVIDSRAFGYLPMTSILGRIIYKVRSSDAHGPVINSPMAAAADAPVIDAEVDAEALAADMDDAAR
ncbi:MAG: hypothetical protein J3K34DRAFT_444121 [Monoraphidium minutum]|nr:MAG: hypothetical protein J3K34DRAFT_444121 [Monoraphidium minutum]